MAVIIVITRLDRPEVEQFIPLAKKIVLGSSIYCDIHLEDKMLAKMQCQIQKMSTGQVIISNLDFKRDILLNETRIRKAAIRANDVVKIGAFLLKVDATQLTEEEIQILNTDYEEIV
jgi:hypothetical protein